MGIKFLSLIRWKNLSLLGLVQLLSYFFLFSSFREEMDFLSISTLISLTILIAAGGYIINDYSDVKIDEINKPDKVIINRYISGRIALVLYFGFNFISVILSLKFGYKVFFLSLFTIIWLWIYSIRFKYQLFTGNFSVAAMTSISIFLVYLCFPRVDFQWIIFYSFFALLTNLLREIVKDIEDIEGDKSYNCETIPIKYGIYQSKQIVKYLIYLTIIFLTVSIIMINLKSEFKYRTLIFSLYHLFFVAIPMFRETYKINNLQKMEDFHSLSTNLKIIMLMGILSMPIYIIKF